MGEQCRVIHTMQRMLLLLNVVCIPLVVVSAQATYDDVEFKCKSGQKVSAVRREKADASGRVGAMSVDCEPLTGAGVGGLQVCSVRISLSRLPNIPDFIRLNRTR